jgi:hypothetical protein
MSKPVLSPLLGKKVETWIRRDVLAEVLDIIVHETDISLDISKIIAIDKYVVECKDEGKDCKTVYNIYLPSWRLWLKVESFNGKKYVEYNFYASD